MKVKFLNIVISYYYHALVSYSINTDGLTHVTFYHEKICGGYVYMNRRFSFCLCHPVT